jgi:hypothetical protein
MTTLHAIEDRLCEAIGLADHQRLSAIHTDTAHLHVHIAIKVHPTTRRNIEPYYDKQRLMEACDALEIRYGLQRTDHGVERQQAASNEKEQSHEQSLDRYAGFDPRDPAYVSGLRESYLAAVAGEQEAETLDGVRNLSSRYGTPRPTA